MEAKWMPEVSVCLKFGSYPINSMKMEDPDTSLG